MKCLNCGKEISDGAKFCTFCGAHQINSTQENSRNYNMYPNTQTSPSIPVQTENPTFVVPPNKPRKKNIRYVLFAIFIPIIVFLLVVSIINVAFKRNSSYPAVNTAIEQFQSSDFLNGYLRSEIVGDMFSIGNDFPSKVAEITNYSVTKVEPAEYNSSLYFVEGEIDWIDDVNKPSTEKFSFSILFTGENAPEAEQIGTYLEAGQYEYQDDFQFSIY